MTATVDRPTNLSIGGWTLISRTRIKNVTLAVMETSATSLSDIANYENSLIVKAAILWQLREAIHFNQLRFYCLMKSVGRVFHIATKRDPLGEGVVQFFTNTTKMPRGCGSFTAFPGDNSTMSKNCQEWGKVG